MHDPTRPTRSAGGTIPWPHTRTLARIAGLTLCVHLAAGCAMFERSEGPSAAYVQKIHDATAAYNAAEFQDAATLLDEADAAARSDAERDRVTDLRRLLSGSLAYAGGDFHNARQLWSSVEDPTLYEQIRRHALDLKIELPRR